MKNNTASAVFVFFFLFFLLLPLSLWAVQGGSYGKSVEYSEYREKSEQPPLSLLFSRPKKYLKKFSLFFQDNLPLRSLFLRFHTDFHHHLLRESGVSKVLLGVEGWLFFQDSFLKRFYQEVDTDWKKKAVTWRKIVERKENFLASRGSRYLFVVAPNKHSVYPEYLGTQRYSEMKWGRLESLIEVFSNTSSPVIFLREPLRNSKSRGLLYFRTDTHWTNLGATLAAREMASTLELSLPILPNKSSTPEQFVGDLSQIWGKHSRFSETVYMPELLPCQKQGVEKSYEFQAREPLRVRRFSCGKGAKTVLLFADSFGEGLLAPLAGVSHTLFSAKQFPSYYEFNFLVEKLQPDIVIEMYVERMLDKLPNKGRRLKALRKND